MNLLIPEAENLVSGLMEHTGKFPAVEVVLAPPFTALSKVYDLIRDTGFRLAGQNAGSEPQGAFTGEVSAAMLKNAGCDYVILGHSERRRIFLEDDDLINRKIRTALDAGLNVIFCIGETLDQREKGQTRLIVQNQLEKGLKGLSPGELEKLVVAYEPVWAIGTGKTATAEQAQEIHSFSREILKTRFGEQAAENTRIQYGGSVTPENSGSLLAQKDIDGALVGTASLKSETFYAIINSVN